MLLIRNVSPPWTVVLYLPSLCVWPAPRNGKMAIAVAPRRAWALVPGWSDVRGRPLMIGPIR